MNVLILKPDHLGDFVLALPSLWELKQKLGNEGRLTVLTAPANREWAQILDWLPEMIPFRHPRYDRPRRRFAPIAWARAIATGLRLKKQRYDYGVELTSTVNDWLGKVVLIATGARRRCGPSGAYDFLLHEAVAVDCGHQTERLAGRFPSDWAITGLAAPSQWMPSRFRWQKKKREDFILLSPWAGSPAKEWSLEHWRALIQKLTRPVKILAPSARLADAQALCGAENQLAPTTSIAETLSWLCRASAAVAVDSATAHFAWLTGTPLVQLFSGTTEPDRWASLGNGARLEAFLSCAPCHLEICDQDIHHCMLNIPVTRAIQETERIVDLELC